MNMNELEVVLQKSLSPDNQERRRAETYLQNASASPEFLDALLSILASGRDGAFPALAFLKQKGEHGSGRDMCKIITALVSFLEMPHAIPKPVVRLAASTISRCSRALENSCTADTEEAETAVEPVVEFFNSAQSCIVMALRTVSSSDSEQDPVRRVRFFFLAQELMQDLSLTSFLRENILSEVVQPMFQWLMTPSLQANACNANSAEAFSICVDVLRTAYEGNISKDLQETFSHYFFSIVPLCFGSTCSLFALIHDWDARGRILQMGSFIVEVLRHYRWAQKLVETTVIRSVMQTLFEDVEYFTSLLNDGDAPDAEESPEESALFFLRRHNACRWSFLSALAAGKGDQRLLHAFSGGEDEVAQFCRLMIEYSCLSQKEAAVLVLEPSEFFRSEEERLVDLPVSLRDYISMTCVQYAKHLGAPFSKVALTTLAEVLLCEPEGPQLGRDREAAMFLLQCLMVGCPGRTFTDPGVRETTVFPMLLATTSQIIHCDAIRGSPLHVARALVVLPRLLMSFSAAGENTETIRRELVSLSLNALAQLSSSQHMLVKVSACKFIFSIIPLCLMEDLSGIIVEGLRPLSLMMQETSLTEECLYTVLETVALLLKTYRRKRLAAANKTDHTAASAVLSFTVADVPHGLYAPLFACWRERLVDPNVGDLIRDIFRELLLSVPDDTSVLTDVEWMRGMLSATGEELCVVPTIIGMLTDLFHHGSMNVAQGAVHVVLNALAQFILSMDFTAIFSASLKCLARLLRRCQPGEAIAVNVPPQCIIAYCNDTSGPPPGSALPLASYSLTTVLTAMSMRILDPQINEVALFNVKTPLMLLIERIQDFSSNETIQIVTAVTSRLHTVKTGTVIQQLMVPLALLFEHHRMALLNVWEGSNQLRDVFCLWLEHLPRFSGVQDLFLCIQSLLLALQDAEARARLEMCVLENWTASSMREAGVRAWETKRGRSKRGTGGASRGGPPVGWVASISLDAAIFVTLGKSLVAFSQQWEDEEAVFSSSESSFASVNSSTDSLLFREDEETEDEDEEDEDEAAAEENDLPEKKKMSGKRHEMFQRMRETFSCMTELGNHYGAVATPLFSSSELASISGFLASLHASSP